MSARLILREPGRYRLEGAIHFGVPLPDDLQSPGIVPAGGSASIALDGLEQADSVVLALLIEWQRQARAQGFRLTLAEIPERMAALIHVTGVGPIFADGP